jgi:hypothetical protein
MADVTVQGCFSPHTTTTDDVRWRQQQNALHKAEEEQKAASMEYN